MTETALAFESITSLSARIRAGRLSPVTCAEELLRRIAALDERLRSFIRVMPERALAQAQAAESALKSGADLGILHGIPYAAKDLFDVKGVPTTAGTRLLADNVAGQDCTVVRKLAAAGMVLLGKTHTVQFAYGAAGINHDQGTPHNPWHPVAARTWRLLERQCGGGGRRPGAHGTGHRHGWIGARARGAVRDRGVEDDGGTSQSCRGLPAVLDARQRRADHPIRRGRGACLSGAAGDGLARRVHDSESPRTMHCGVSRTA